jgi:hypothetical protein
MTLSQFFDPFLADIDWFDAVVGAVLIFVIGWLWYGPLFGKQWSNATGRDMGSGRPDPWTILKGFLQFFAFGLGVTLVFGAVHRSFGNAPDFETLLVTSLAVSFFVVGMGLMNRVVWEDGSPTLWAIDWSFWFVSSFFYGWVVLDLLA